MEKFLRLVKVKTLHQKNFPRTVRVESVSSKSALDAKFKDEKGNEISVADYFNTQYGIRLK